MNKAFIDEMRQKLEEEYKKLENELSQFAHRNTKTSGTDFDTKFPEYGDDEDENASEIADYSNNLSLERELEKALRDVESALKRLEKGIYTTCKYCESEISEARLRARPTSTSCIACKKTLTQEI
ncbi:MAG: TraR/DksA C4-type zinc finger protein [Patescibacteria group bacterium]|nr:TraR/DksA C4-type zinc finger protein [Patescibacteria group bacterium]